MEQLLDSLYSKAHVQSFTRDGKHRNANTDANTEMIYDVDLHVGTQLNDRKAALAEQETLIRAVDLMSR